MPDISAPELKAKLDRGDKFVLLDVREPFECDICQHPRRARSSRSASSRRA